MRTHARPAPGNRGRLSLFVLGAVVASACASVDKKRAMAMDTATREMQCEALETQDVENLAFRGRFRMSGCGQEQTYVVQCKLLGGCETSTEEVRAARQQPAPTYASTPTPDPATSSPGAPQDGGAPAPASSYVSVTLVNECPQTVNLFFGDKPKFGSGRSSTIGANTRTSHSGSAGDMIWITDASGNGISSATLGAGMREVRITASCSGLTTS